MTTRLPFPYAYAFAVATVVSAFTILQAYIPYIQREEAFPVYFAVVPVLTSNFLWALACPLIYPLVRFGGRQDRSRLSRVAVLGPAAIGIAFLHRLIAEGAFLTKYYFEDPDSFAELLAHVWPRFLVGAVSSFVELWIIAGAFLAFDFYNRYRDKKLELALTEKALTRAQLSALRMRLRPHFLFNTLHTVASLMDEDVRGARLVLSRLGNLLRRMLDADRDREHMVSLERELESCSDYLGIESVRFHDRLRVTYDIASDTLSAEVPSLLLQPLVENAIKHGFADRPDGGCVEVGSRCEAERLTLWVSDDGCGMADPARALQRPGVGLENVRERLRTIYPDAHTLDVESANNSGFRVRLSIPFRAASTPEATQ